MHATPESSGLNQSPLAAEPTCARYPYVVGTIHSEERNGCRDTNRASSAPLRPRNVDLFAASASRSNGFQPRGSWAPLMGLSEHVTRAQLHGLLGKQSTPDRRGRSEPPEQAQVLKPGAGLFHPKNPERLSFFSRILTARHVLPNNAGVASTARLGKLATPAQCGRAEPPNLLLLSVGNPWNYAPEMRIEIRKSAIASIAL